MNNKNAIKRIFIGFGVLIVLMTGLAIWSIFSIGSLVGNAEEVIEGNKIKADMNQREIDHLLWAESLCAIFTDHSIKKVTVQTDPAKCAFGSWYYSDARKHVEEAIPALKEPLAAIEDDHNALHHSARDIDKCFQQIDTRLGSYLRDMKIAHLQWDARLQTAIISGDAGMMDGVELNPDNCAFGKWLKGEDFTDLMDHYPGLQVHFDSLIRSHDELHKSAQGIRLLLQSGQTAQASAIYRENINPKLEEVMGTFDQILSWFDDSISQFQTAQNIFVTETIPALKKVQSHLHGIIETVNENVLTDEGMLNQASISNTVIIITGVVALAAGIAIALTTGLTIRKSLTDVMKAMLQGSMEIASASSQVASGSEVLASETSEQAASIEEISSSLQEITSMIKMTSQNTEKANDLTSEAKSSAHRGSDSMEMMSDAINKIRTSADETSKIVKTIDEIAFQTNLLALNAAVEAARAGEAGKGFAVVAEEVRNLAQRSAEAARSTSSLIEESIENAKNGVRVNEQASGALGEIVEQVEKITVLVGEISNAAAQQATGIDEVSRSVVQMDAITQNNAANAEESATAAEEMNSQAEELQRIVDQLAALCGVKETENNLKLLENKASGKKRLTRKASLPERTTKPEQALHLSEDDF